MAIEVRNKKGKRTMLLSDDADGKDIVSFEDEDITYDEAMERKEAKKKAKDKKKEEDKE